MAGITTSAKPGLVNTGQSTAKGYAAPLMVVTLLFFMWGFITCLNDILIPKLQEVFTLQLWQAMLIQTAFFGAYFVVSLAYFIVSVTKGDPISKIGYKNGIVVGLIVSAIGCALFFPAAGLESYGFFLTALFVLASGITVLQIAANPYVSVLGSPEGASSRLNLTQAFNSFGTTLAPVLGGYLIFEGVEEVTHADATSVQLPYLGLAATLLVIALVFKVIRLPKITESEEAGTTVSGKGALQYRHLVLGIICVFAYVGGEVAVGSAVINFIKLPEIAGYDEAKASQFLAIFWGGAMVGRFFGAAALAQFKNSLNRYLSIGLVAIIAFFAIYSIFGMDMALIALALIIVNIVVLLLGRFIPSRTLGLFAAAVMVLLLLTIFTQGELAMWSLIGVGLFNSLMFPTIFTLAISGLGNYTGQGSSLLVMAIVGGAIIPPLQGVVADFSSLQISFVVPLICYIFVMYYGFYGYKPRQVKE